VGQVVERGAHNPNAQGEKIWEKIL